MTFHGKRHAHVLGDRLDAKVIPVDPQWEANGPIPNVGYRKPISSREIEQWAEAEYVARTEGDMVGRPTCPTCDLRVSLGGICGCGSYGEGTRALAAIQGMPLTWWPSEGTDAAPIGEGSHNPDRGDDVRYKGPRKGDWSIKPRAAKPTSADLPDLPENATADEVAAWRKRYEEIKASR